MSKRDMNIEMGQAVSKGKWGKSETTPLPFLELKVLC